MDFIAIVQPLVWGRNQYNVIKVPTELVANARLQSTHRLAGAIEGFPVNAAITKAPVVDFAFLYLSAAFLRRIEAEVGDPVECRLAPVDPDLVALPEDVEEALLKAGRLSLWEGLRPAEKRKRLAIVESVQTQQARARRISALVAGFAQ